MESRERKREKARENCEGGRERERMMTEGEIIMKMGGTREENHDRWSGNHGRGREEKRERIIKEEDGVENPERRRKKGRES